MGPSLPGPVAAVCTALAMTASAAAVEYRTIDGTGNNLRNPTWGSAGVQLRRITPIAYGDGISTPAGATRDSARAISNAVMAQDALVFNPYERSDYVWMWGQFLDHDISLTPEAHPPEPFNIPVPAGDPVFDPGGTGMVELPLNRSTYDPATGAGGGNPRQQVNVITAWLDGSVVYGSDPDRASWLREGVSGRLKVTQHATFGDLLPFNDGTQPNAGGPGTHLFVAGDVRANENVALTAVHTLFVREHNRLAGEIAAANPTWSDEQVYQRTRRIVGAEVQKITYRDFLPTILGADAPGPYRRYRRRRNPNILNCFSTTAYRFGHSAVGPTLLRLDADGQEIPEGHMDLAEAFFNPSAIADEAGIDPLLRGACFHRHQQIDHRVIDELRNLLFGHLDLAALNIQRGRDHGLPDYNTARRRLGLRRVRSFEEISPDPAVQQALAAVYDDVNDIDLWVGGLCEDDEPGAVLGPLFCRILKRQFEAIRDGDRFWYARDPELADLFDWIEGRTLGDIIADNTPITGLQENVFYIPAPATLALLAACGPALARRRRRFPSSR